MSTWLTKDEVFNSKLDENLLDSCLHDDLWPNKTLIKEIDLFFKHTNLTEMQKRKLVDLMEDIFDEKR